jgi:enterobacterial common antigen flippase
LSNGGQRREPSKPRRPDARCLRIFQPIDSAQSDRLLVLMPSIAKPLGDEQAESTASLESCPVVSEEKPEPTSHAEALKSTSIIGGSTVIVMVVRMLRTKVLAILLGPAGIGLEAVFDSVITLSKTAVDLGISSAGVRQIAAAVGSGSQPVIATTVFTLRRVCLVLGIIGAVTLFLCREPVGRLAFGNTDHSSDIGLLSIILLFGAVMGGQGALLQGMRRIGDLAKMNIFGALAGAVLSIPIVYVWGRAGIPAYMVLGAGVGVLTSWYYARRVRIEPVKVPFRQITSEARNLLKLGLVFLASGLMTAGALFLLRIFVARQEGVYGAGQFQAASALSMVYVGFVLQAMGTDFYPRLTVLAADNRRCNQLVNEQAEISILLALPGVLATLALAPWVIQLFYSNKFDKAAEILCWQVTGTFLQVNSWPMGFILLAKGRAAALFWTDLASYSVYVVLGWVGLKLFGLPGTGMAFLGLYAFHWVVVFAIVRRISGFALSPTNVRLSLLGVATVAVTLVTRLTLPEPWATGIGCLLALATGLYTTRTLVQLVGVDKISGYLRKLGLSFLARRLKPKP